MGKERAAGAALAAALAQEGQTDREKEEDICALLPRGTRTE